MSSPRPPALNAPRRPPHAATLVQPKAAWPSPSARPPHAATIVQPKAPWTALAARPPHPATIAQPRARYVTTAAQAPLAQPRGAQADARVPASGALQRMEVLEDWFCFKCAVTQQAAYKEDLPAKGCGGGVKKAHQWQPGTGKKAPKKKIEIVFEEVEEVRIAPARFNEARTWDELRVIIAPWADWVRARVNDGPQRIFSNLTTSVDSVIGGVERAVLGKGQQARNLVVDETVNDAKSLTHTGMLRARALSAEGDLLFTFYGAAANVYIDSMTREVSWLVNGKNPKHHGGSCHTEQMCLYHLHNHLLGLDDGVLAQVTLEWWTELAMCELWCHPAMALFTAHWKKSKVKVGWELGRL